MSAECFAAAIAAARDQFAVTLADTPELRHEAFRVRHQVYCIERGYEPAAGSIETDEFDARSRHVLLSRRDSGEIVGTVRVVLHDARRPQDSFPLQRVTAPGLLRHLPLSDTAEISRFSLSKDRRATSGPAGVLMRLGLIQGAIRVFGQEGLTHWCAIVERSLLRLLQATAIHVEPVGPMVEFHGMRQPVTCSLGDMLARVRRERPEVWDFLTEGGTLWSEPERALAA